MTRYDTFLLTLNRGNLTSLNPRDIFRQLSSKMLVICHFVVRNNIEGLAF